MSLVNFTDTSLEQLRGILGSYGNEQVGRLIKSTSTYVESRWFKVTEEIENTTLNPDGSTNDEKEYKASEVMMDGTVVPNGIWFDSDAIESNDPDDPIYFSNLKLNGELFTGEVEVGKAYQVEFIAPKTYEDETVYYIIPKGGGGGGETLWASIKSVVDQRTYIGDVHTAPANALPPIATDVTIKAENLNFGELTPNTSSYYVGNYNGFNFHISPPTWG